MICMLVAEHRAVPRSSRIAATAVRPAAASPTSVVSSRFWVLLGGKV